MRARISYSPSANKNLAERLSFSELDQRLRVDDAAIHDRTQSRVPPRCGRLADTFPIAAVRGQNITLIVKSIADTIGWKRHQRRYRELAIDSKQIANRVVVLFVVEPTHGDATWIRDQCRRSTVLMRRSSKRHFFTQLQRWQVAVVRRWASPRSRSIRESDSNAAAACRRVCSRPRWPSRCPLQPHRHCDIRRSAF